MNNTRKVVNQSKCMQVRSLTNVNRNNQSNKLNFNMVYWYI